MGRIKIKGRRENIELDDTRCQKLKNKWLGLNGERKADIKDLVDIGDWAGEYSQIDSIEIVKEKIDPRKIVFSDNQISVLHSELIPYLNEKGELTLEKEFEFLSKEKGLLKFKKIGAGKTMSDFVVRVCKDTTAMMSYYEKFIEAWKMFKGRQYFIEKKKLEGYAEMAESSMT